MKCNEKNKKNEKSTKEAITSSKVKKKNRKWIDKYEINIKTMREQCGLKRKLVEE